MAGTVAPKVQRVTAAIAGEARSTAGAFDAGAIVMGSIDVSSYATSGVTVRAADLGLGFIYDAVFASKETTKSTSSLFIPNANGLTGELWLYDTDSTFTEVSNGADAGEWSFVASGLPAGSANS